LFKGIIKSEKVNPKSCILFIYIIEASAIVLMMFVVLVMYL